MSDTITIDKKLVFKHLPCPENIWIYYLDEFHEIGRQYHRTTDSGKITIMFLSHDRSCWFFMTTILKHANFYMLIIIILHRIDLFRVKMLFELIEVMDPIIRYSSGAKYINIIAIYVCIHMDKYHTICIRSFETDFYFSFRSWKINLNTTFSSIYYNSYLLLVL